MQHSHIINNFGVGTYRLNENQCYPSTVHALKYGSPHVDSAPLYGNIVEVGKAIKDSGRIRKDIHVTVKISRDKLESGEIAESLEQTMHDMGLDYVDEAILHEPIDPVQNWKHLVDFYQTSGKGKILSIGVSNFNQDILEQIIDDIHVPNPVVNQIEINPFLTRGTLPEFCTSKGIQVVAHTPLAKGELFHNKKLETIAEKYNVSCAQIMLRWGLQKGYRVIPRSSNFKHIEQNMSLNFKIDDSDMAILTSLDIGYATHPKYLTQEEKKRFYKLRKDYKKKR